MRTSILLAAIATLVFATPTVLDKRAESASAKNIVKAVNNIMTQIKTLEADVKAFSSSSPLAITQVLAIQQQTDTVGQALQNATAACKAAKKLNEDDSGTVAVPVINLSNETPNLLNLLIKKKPDFDHAILMEGSVSNQVHQSLVQQKQYTVQFSNALTAKLASDYAGAAPYIIGPLLQDFDQAIKVFSKPGGLFALPAEPTFQAFELEVNAAVAQKGLPSGVPTGVSTTISLPTGVPV